MGEMIAWIVRGSWGLAALSRDRWMACPLAMRHSNFDRGDGFHGGRSEKLGTISIGFRRSLILLAMASFFASLFNFVCPETFIPVVSSIPVHSIQHFINIRQPRSRFVAYLTLILRWKPKTPRGGWCLFNTTSKCMPKR